MAQERESYLAAGMDACLTKPIDWPQLFAAVEEHEAPPVESAPAQQAAADAAGAPLVDAATHATLLDMAGPEHLAEWLQVGLQAYEEGCAAMAGADAARIAAEAHKIKGSAGTLGLPALHRAARELEQSAHDGTPAEPQLQALRSVLERTRAALVAQRLLG
jgi:HPt (histidine-containing phosphotransfer) domain-containing protein